jgi:copper/silver efflux system protein
MWSVGTGADVMKRIAAPMIGGIFTSFILELVVYPGLYQVWKWHFDLKPHSRETNPSTVPGIEPAQAAD